MKDPVFSGRDVSEAVRSASRTLGIPERVLRYVVLEQGQASGRGLGATEARIAVLIERPVPAAASPNGGSTDVGGREPREERKARHGTHVESRPAAGDDWEAGVRDIVQRWGRAADSELAVDVAETRSGVDVLISGPGVRALFDPMGEALAALEHVIERVQGRALAGRRVRVRCEGYREYRDEALRERALGLARQVLEDGQARTTEPLNSYERRVIHVALEPLAGVETYSVGEGHARRVTVAPSDGEEKADVPPRAAPAAAEPNLAERATSSDGRPESDTVPEAVTGSGPKPASEPVSQPVDYREFDRPPEGGGGAGLM